MKTIDFLTWNVLDRRYWFQFSLNLSVAWCNNEVFVHFFFNFPFTVYPRNSLKKEEKTELAWKCYGNESWRNFSGWGIQEDLPLCHTSLSRFKRLVQCITTHQAWTQSYGSSTFLNFGFLKPNHRFWFLARYLRNDLAKILLTFMHFMLFKSSHLLMLRLLKKSMVKKPQRLWKYMIHSLAT